MRVDNDAFNFWQMPGARPDREYTSGFFAQYEEGAIPWWGGRLVGTRAACARGRLPCVSRVMTLTQLIYTPERRQQQPEPPPGSRPDAGWLTVQDGIRIERAGSRDEFSMQLGVTGPPALGEFTQKIAHAFAPGFNRPTGWEDQVPFSVGVGVRGERTLRRSIASRGAWRAELLPRASVELGNILTAAELGVRTRIGWRLDAPWGVSSDRSDWSVALTLGLAGRAIARNTLLDDYVTRESRVNAMEWGVNVRHRWVELRWGSVTESRAHRAAPPQHTWSTVSAAVSF